MKNKFKKAFISGAIMATGLAVGYAASTALQDLDVIKNNFDYILSLNTSKQAKIDELDIEIAGLDAQIVEIDGLNTTIADLEAQIVELNNSGNQAEIDRLNAEIEKLKKTQNNSGSQQRIKELEEQVAGLIIERDTLKTERNGLIAERDGLITERDKLKTERDSLIAERDKLEIERDALKTERDTLKTQRDNAVEDNSKLEAKITELLNYTNDKTNELVDGE